METLSFTKKVKEEIVNQEQSELFLKSLLSAFVKINGSINFSNGKEALVLTTENANIAKLVYTSINKIFDIVGRFSYSKIMNFKKRTSFKIIYEQDQDKILEGLEINYLDGRIPRSLTYDETTIAGYLCGAFLATGSVNSPSSSNYHLEIGLNDENHAKWLLKQFDKYKVGNFDAKVVLRREKPVVYIKKAEQIVNFLIMIGATNSALDFEGIRLDRDFANNDNRLQILDAANFNKTMSASEKQIEEIKIIDRIIGINSLLNEKQRLICKIRLENEEASFKEISEIASEKLGQQISRSNINHIFRSIHQIAEKYKQ